MPGPQFRSLWESPFFADIGAGHYNAEVEKAGVGSGRVSPAIIPDSTNPEVRERQLTAHYGGNVR